MLKHPLVVIGAVLIAALIFYYAASPYQNCVRRFADIPQRDEFGGLITSTAPPFVCFQETNW